MVLPAVLVMTLARFVHTPGEEVGLRPQPVGDFPQVADRTAIAVQVDIAAVGQAVGEPALIAGFQPRWVIMENADTGFAQIVVARPGEVANHMAVVFHDVPQFSDLRGIGFGAHHHPLWMRLVNVCMTGVQVIVAGYVHRFFNRQDAFVQQRAAGKGIHHLLLHIAGHGVHLLGTLRVIHRLVVFLPLVLHMLLHVIGHRQEAADSIGHIAGGIQLMEGVHQLFVHFMSGGAANLGNLVAGGVQHHTGMIVILAHHARHLILPDKREIQGKIVGVLLLAPHVRQLVHDQNAQFVASPQHGLGGRVMGAADAVEARFLQFQQAEFFRRLQGGRADDAVVMMDAGAPQLDGFAVDAQALFGGKGQSAQADAFFVFVQKLTSGVPHCQPKRVQERMLRRPQPHIGQAAVHFSGGIPIQDMRLLLCADHPVAVQQFHGHGNSGFGILCVLHLISHADFRRALLGGEGGQPHTVGFKGLPAAFPEDHIPVDAAAGIPAGSKLLIDRNDLEGILLVKSERAAHIDEEAAVAVLMAGQQAIVQIHQRLGHDAFKLDQDGFFHPLGRSFKLLGVGIGLGRIIARLILARTVFVPRLQDHRVLGQRHRAALGNRSEKDRVEGLIDALLDIPVCMIAACLHSICPLSFIIR